MAVEGNTTVAMIRTDENSSNLLDAIIVMLRAFGRWGKQDNALQLVSLLNVRQHIPSRLKVFCMYTRQSNSRVLCLGRCFATNCCVHVSNYFLFSPRHLIADSKRSYTLHSQQLQTDTHFVFYWWREFYDCYASFSSRRTVSAFCVGTQRYGVPAILLAVTHSMPVPKFRTGAKIGLISCFYFNNSVTVLNKNFNKSFYIF